MTGSWRRSPGHALTSVQADPRVIAAVFDGGALDQLLDDRIRRFFVEAFRDSRSRMLLPAVVVTEFLTGHAGDLERAHRVLNIFEEPVAVSGALATRAAMLRLSVLRRGGPDPGLVDSIVAAIGEVHGVVVTLDRSDFALLASAGRGYVIFDVTELRGALPRSRGRRRR